MADQDTATQGLGDRRQPGEPEADPREILVHSMLELVARTGWRGLTLNALSRHCGVPLAIIRRHYADKSDILADWRQRVDTEMLARLSQAWPCDTPRDRVFEAIMARLEVLAPHRAALRAIMDEREGAPFDQLAPRGAEARAAFWLVVGADVEASGVAGIAKRIGIGWIYAQTVKTWLDEDDPDCPRTMARLDTALRRGEGILRRVETALELGRGGAMLAREVYRRCRASGRGRGEDKAREAGSPW